MFIVTLLLIFVIVLLTFIHRYRSEHTVVYPTLDKMVDFANSLNPGDLRDEPAARNQSTRDLEQIRYSK